MRLVICSLVAVATACLTVGDAMGALASGGKATTSANLSTNPTIRKQQLLADPGNEGDPLILIYAKLDVAIHLDTPLGTTAFDIVESIHVSPLAPFVADGTLPFYDAVVPSKASFNVSFLPSGRDILISDIAVMAVDPNLPPPGEIDHALIDVQFNSLLPDSVYQNILGTYTVQANTSTSLIRGKDPDTGVITTFGPADIIPATDSEILGAPEPTMLSPLMLGIAAAFYRRRRRLA